MIFVLVVGLTNLKGKGGRQTALGKSSQDLGELGSSLSSREFPLSKAGLDS